MLSTDHVKDNSTALFLVSLGVVVVTCVAVAVLCLVCNYGYFKHNLLERIAEVTTALTYIKIIDHTPNTISLKRCIYIQANEHKKDTSQRIEKRFVCSSCIL